MNADVLSANKTWDVHSTDSVRANLSKVVVRQLKATALRSALIAISAIRIAPLAATQFRAYVTNVAAGDPVAKSNQDPHRSDIGRRCLLSSYQCQPTPSLRPSIWPRQSRCEAPWKSTTDPSSQFPERTDSSTEWRAFELLLSPLTSWADCEGGGLCV